jgi:hypothetical protein
MVFQAICICASISDFLFLFGGREGRGRGAKLVALVVAPVAIKTSIASQGLGAYPKFIDGISFSQPGSIRAPIFWWENSWVSVS